MALVTETSLIAILKWAIGTVGVGIFGWFAKRQRDLEEKLDDVYSKKEAQEQIELRMQPYKDAVQSNTQAVEKLTDVLTELRIDFAEVKADVKAIKNDKSSRPKG